ncbi:GSCOCG00003733001-RA-CDS [Cotesia congregata]|nr:GSCOCG00003733001-RA-CDS [Cotesia congregata]
MDNFPDKKLNNLNSPKVAEKVINVDENMSKNPEESVNLQSSSTKQLPDKVILQTTQISAESLPHSHLIESTIHETKMTKKSRLHKRSTPEDSQRGHENIFWDQHVSKNDESLNINSAKATKPPINDFSLPKLPSKNTPTQGLNDGLFVFGEPKVNVETKQFTFSLKPKEVQRKSASPDKKQLNEDESLISLLTCINSLNTIISKAEKSKVIGIFDSPKSNDTNTIKSALLQLRLAPDKAPWVEKAVFVNNQVPASEFIIRENILFGNEYDAQRYHSAIALSCLREDLKLLANGDKTVIDKKHLQLTDTQKEKLALARAFYANTDIYILEDVLNSIDKITGECIFETLIRGALEEKVVIFITHNPTYLSQCDEIYVITNGEIIAQGDHRSLLQSNELYASMINASIDSIVNKNVQITMKDELNSSERKKAAARTLRLNIKIMIIFFTIVLTLLYVLQHVSMEQFCIM